MKTIYLAGGCFWGVQRYMDQFEGICKTSVGYANGHTEDPCYEEVKAQITGHTETCEIVYDEDKITLKEILEHFYVIVDPTSLNKQGEDIGTSYRCGIYYTGEEDIPTILEVTNLEKTKYDKPFVIEIEPLKIYYLAEEYHQKYLEKNPNGYCHIDKCYFKN